METKQSYQAFTELNVWQAARDLKNAVADLVQKFPIEEKFRLTDQLIRSTRSIGSNIAEGHGRYSYKDQLRFCVQARGSLSETLNHIIDAMDSSYIDKQETQIYKTKIDNTGKLLNGYINFLRDSLNSSKKDD